VPELDYYPSSAKKISLASSQTSVREKVSTNSQVMNQETSKFIAKFEEKAKG